MKILRRILGIIMIVGMGLISPIFFFMIVLYGVNNSHKIVTNKTDKIIDNYLI